MLEFREIIKYIFIIGAAQGLLLSFFLFNRKENLLANKILGFTIVAFVLDLIGGVIYMSGYYVNIPWILGLSNSFPYLYGPAIYIYTRSLGHSNEMKASNILPHFIPFMLVHVYGLLFFYFEPSSYQLSLLNFSEPQPWHIQLVGNLIPVHGCIYMAFTVYKAYKYNKELKNSFSDIDEINLYWLRFIVYGTAIIWSIVILAYGLNSLLGDEFQANMLIYIGLSVFLYLMGIKALKQPEIKFIVEENRHSEKQYKKSGLSAEVAEKNANQIIAVILEEQPYLNSKFNLTDLSKLTGISTHNLSETINSHLNTSFYDFINSYRVKEVINFFSDKEYEHYSTLAIGYEAGFSSKSAFYSAFKKSTGKTPAQFRKEASQKKAA